MDVDVARWVIEFLLRQSMDDRILNAVLRLLPLPNDNSSLKKAMLLRRIDSEVARGRVSEKVLGLLERIEELDYGEGVSVSEAMKGAYCAVAVDCTVRLLDESEDKEGKYFDAVKRIWRGRIWKMEGLEKVGLVSDELQRWMDEIEAGVWDTSVCENVRMKSRGNDALEAVRAYLAEAWKGMGPSFLELLAGTVSDDIIREIMGLGNNQICNPVGERAPSLQECRQDLIVSNKDKETQRGVAQPRRKHIAVKRSRGAMAGTSRGAKIINTEELNIRTSSNNYKSLPSPEVEKVQEALRTSSLELQAVVKDPLPDALQLAENVISRMGRENMNQKPSVERNGVDVDAPNPSVRISTEATLASEPNTDNQCGRLESNVPKLSLMARNSTARTYEWDDSMDSLPEGSPDRGSRLHLPSPKRSLVSPLRKYDITKFARRRKMKKWSILEEDTLRTGVQKYGKGNWKVILNSYRDIFEERTEVDLKDKWRNMIRY